jgi:uncharacterized protein YbjT (DUF2867 family)
MDILVTGGTGTLGRVVVERLQARGHVPRVVSRRAGEGRVVGDLETGVGMAEAVRGVDAVVHAASRPGHDVAQAKTLLAALRTEGARGAAGAAAAGDVGRHTSPHLMFVSIVGVARVPLAYYRDKVEVERLVAASGVPWTVLRATQFHDLLTTLFGVLGRSPVLPVLAGASFQPVDVRDVAERLADLVTGAPTGRAPDLGGPQVRSMADLARAWTGARRAGAARCCRYGCPADSPARYGTAACSPRTMPMAGSLSRSSWPVGRRTRRLRRGATAVGDRGPRTSRHDLAHRAGCGRRAVRRIGAASGNRRGVCRPRRHAVPHQRSSTTVAG